MVVWDAARLAGRFDTFSLKSRSFLVFPDVDPEGLSSKRASLLTLFKSVTSWEPVVTEKKHSSIGNYVFEGNVILCHIK